MILDDSKSSHKYKILANALVEDVPSQTNNNRQSIKPAWSRESGIIYQHISHKSLILLC